MSDIEIPEQVKKTLYVTIGVGQWNYNDVDISSNNFTGSDGFERVNLTSIEVTIDIPKGIDVKSELIAILEDQKASIQSEFHMQLKNVQDKIDNLLAIENKSE